MRNLLLILDFDGTLTPIVKSPEVAHLSFETGKLLKSLSQKPNLYLAIVSGRKLKDLKEKIHLPGITYGGNHGLEGGIFGKKFLFPVENNKLIILKKIREQLSQIVNKFPGVFIENKNLALSFHFRLADKQQLSAIKSIFKKILTPYAKDNLISVIPGKMVFDILPKVNWDKGSFAKLIIKKIQTQTKVTPVVIFIGDDATDEDVFRALNKDITIKVGGSRKSSAKYSLRNTKEVFEFLKRIENLL